MSVETDRLGLEIMRIRNAITFARSEQVHGATVNDKAIVDLQVELRALDERLDALRKLPE